jgi:hypothetical protein
MTRYSAEGKRRLLEEWKAGGQGAGAFARENGVKGQTFSNRVKKEAAEKRQKFVELRPGGGAPCSNRITIETGSIKIHLPRGLSGKEIRAVVEGTGLPP